MQFKFMTSKTHFVAIVALAGCALPANAVSVQIPAPKPKTMSPAPKSNSNAQLASMTCPAKELQYLVGQPRTVLQTMRFGGEVRIEERGQAYPADFYPMRTRIIIGARGKIERIVCG
jgi:hypothetical protein